jgi:hypothetical protein
MTAAWDGELDGTNASSVSGNDSERQADRRESVQWTRVATAAGTPNAVVIAGRLEAEGIPTQVTQEAAGRNVFPVLVGRLGEAIIWVPENEASRALEILSTEFDEEE